MAQETTGDVIRRMRKALGISQKELSEKLDCSQGALSSWESDDPQRSPSAAICLRLSALAFDPDDSIFFLTQGGISPDVVVSVAAQLCKGGVNMDPILPVVEQALGEKLGLKSEREVEGMDFIVPPVKGMKSLPFEVSVPATLVSNLTSTVYIVATAKDPFTRAGYGVDPGDIIVFDTDAASYGGGLGEKVVFRFADGLYVGRLGYISDAAVPRLVIGPSDEPPSNWSFHTSPKMRIIESFHVTPPHPDALAHRPEHKGGDLLGVWLAQYSTGAQESWKRAAKQNEPKEEQRRPRGTIR